MSFMGVMKDNRRQNPREDVLHGLDEGQQHPEFTWRCPSLA